MRQQDRGGPYRCPDPRDVVELVSRLCDWLRREFAYSSGNQTFADAVVQAIVTHVYIEWIHPFGDGNGRTGRLLEFSTRLPEMAEVLASALEAAVRPTGFGRARPRPAAEPPPPGGWILRRDEGSLGRRPAS